MAHGQVRLIYRLLFLNQLIYWDFQTGLEGFCSKPICWETYVGQQFYMLTVVDFLAQVGIMALIDLPRYWIQLRKIKDTASSITLFLSRSIFLGEKLANSEWKRVHYFLGCIEFGISKHVLDIVYSQTICWLAIFFAPLITIVTFIKFGLMYFLKILYILYVRIFGTEARNFVIRGNFFIFVELLRSAFHLKWHLQHQKLHLYFGKFIWNIFVSIW